MDNFLQLVPIENDSDSDQGLVYGEDEAVGADVAALEEHIQRHAPPLGFAAASGEHAADNDDNEEEIDPPSTGGAFNPLAHFEGDEALDGDERERREYLARAKLLEAYMQQAERDTQQRLDAMARILALSDPLEQLSEYMALKLDERHRRYSPDVDITPELLECAKRLTSRKDSEIALLGAFFFACDPAPCPKPRGAAAMLPVVAAMMEGGAATTSLEI